MLEILKFIFSSFWVWLGTFLLCAVIATGLGEMRQTIFYKRRRKSKAMKTSDA